MIKNNQKGFEVELAGSLIHIGVSAEIEKTFLS